MSGNDTENVALKPLQSAQTQSPAFEWFSILTCISMLLLLYYWLRGSAFKADIQRGARFELKCPVGMIFRNFPRIASNLGFCLYINTGCSLRKTPN